MVSELNVGFVMFLFRVHVSHPYVAIRNMHVRIVRTQSTEPICIPVNIIQKLQMCYNRLKSTCTIHSLYKKGSFIIQDMIFYITALFVDLFSGCFIWRIVFHKLK